MTATQIATLSEATTWQVDPAHTHVEFAVKHLVMATVRGRCGSSVSILATPIAASICAREKSSPATITVPVTSLKRDGHLKSPDVDKYPTLRFKRRRTERQPHDSNRYQLVGDLTLHGVTKEIVHDATLEGLTKDPYGNRRAGFSATGKINRKDFGLSWNQLIETGGVVVGEEVKISIDAEVVAKPA